MGNQEVDVNISANAAFEIRARVFYCMTGLLAPGKDSPAAGALDRAERDREWHTFIDNYGKILNDTICAVQYVFRD